MESEVKLKKLEHLHITVRVTNQFRLRMWAGGVALHVAAWFLGCGVTVVVEKPE